MSRISEIAEARKRAHKKLLDLDSRVYRAFLDMEKATYSDWSNKTDSVRYIW